MKSVRWILVLVLTLGLQQAALADPVFEYFRAVQLDTPGALRKWIAQVDPNTLSPVSGEPALVMALREDALRSFAVLLAHPGIQIELSAPNGNNALMMAAFRHHKQAVLDLLAKGAVVNRPGWSALHYAAASGDDEICRILLAHKAALNAPARGLLTPLMIAAREGHESTVRLLLTAGADASLTDSDKQTAAQIATKLDKAHIAAAIAAHLAANTKP
jgi:ankyrin repeat protein